MSPTPAPNITAAEIKVIDDLRAILNKLPAGVSVVARDGALQVWCKRHEGRSRTRPPGQRWLQLATIALPDAPGLQAWASQAARNARVLEQVQEIDACTA